LLLVAAHGVTLLLDRGRSHLRPWRAAVAAAVAVLSPLIFLGYREDQALGWVTRPGVGTLAALVSDFAGSRQLITLVIATAVCGVVSGRAAGRRPAGGPGPNGPEAARGPGVTVVTVALPWLVLPPFTLLAVSVVRPVYVERYVVFGQPALALLSAAGVAWLAGLAAASQVGRRIPALAWSAPLAIAALLVAIVIGPQRAARLTSARPDNLRAVSAVVAAHERPGDAILYIPSDARVVSTGYPAPFRRLRDLALKEPAAASDTLTGVEVPASALAGRSAGIRRLWLVQWADQMSVTPGGEMGREKLALARSMHLIRRWTVQSVVLSLYAAGHP
jgi:mannosyltransferase